jgi:hypothetical protein
MSLLGTYNKNYSTLNIFLLLLIMSRVVVDLKCALIYNGSMAIYDI